MTGSGDPIKASNCSVTPFSAIGSIGAATQNAEAWNKDLIRTPVRSRADKVHSGHSLATALVKLKVDPKTVQGVLRHEDFGTTMELYAQSDMESMRNAQGKFLEQLMGDRIHLLTERVQ